MMLNGHFVLFVRKLILVGTAASVISGCAAAKIGGDVLFGDTNPYVDPQIEKRIAEDNLAPLYEEAKTSAGIITPYDDNSNPFNNAGMASITLPPAHLRCIDITDGTKGKCVTSAEEEFFSQNEKHYLYINHPYFVSLRNAARACTAIDVSEDQKGVEATCRVARQRLVNLYLEVADQSCTQRLASIGAGPASTNLFLRFTNITSSAVATFAGVASTARWLSALSLASSETGALLNDEVFSQAINFTMANKIVSEQEKLRQKIEENLLKPMRQYGVDMAINDARQYNRQCSYAHGQALVTGVGQTTEDPLSVSSLQTRITRLEEIRKSLTGELDRHKNYSKYSDLNGLSESDRDASREQVSARLTRVKNQIGQAQDQLIATQR